MLDGMRHGEREKERKTDDKSAARTKILHSCTLNSMLSPKTLIRAVVPDLEFTACMIIALVLVD